jgi:hypothetical protein
MGRPTVKFKQIYSWIFRGLLKRLVATKCNHIDVNTPTQPWHQVFTKTILNRMVKYTNKYGEINWPQDVDRYHKNDLKSFFAALFVAFTTDIY